MGVVRQPRVLHPQRCVVAMAAAKRGSLPTDLSFPLIFGKHVILYKGVAVF